MTTLKAIANSLLAGRQKRADIDLTRQSIGRALSGDHNFGVTMLLAIAEANGQEVLIVPRGTVRALIASD